MSDPRKRKSRGPVESVEGRYTPIPHALLDSAAFIGAGVRAKAILFDLLRQHNGKNNGHLQLADGYLRARGWTSKDQIHKAKNELIERGLIVCTRRGGLNSGPSLYAMTWLKIDDFRGLDLSDASYRKGAWSMMDPVPTVAKSAIQKHESYPATRGGEKREEPPAMRGSTTPSRGVAGASTTPPHGAKTAIFGGSTTPPHGNNECLPVEVRKAQRAPVVGLRGSSGLRSVPPTSPRSANDET